MTSPAGSVLIIGAGVSGLTAAGVLAKHGWRVRIIERESERRGGGFLVSLSDEAYRVGERLGVIERLRAQTYAIKRSSYHDKRGRALLELDYGRLFGALQVIQPMRNDLAAALEACLPENTAVEHGMWTDAIHHDDGAAEVCFNTGERARFDVVIGADGVHSTTRAQALGDVPLTRRPLGLFCAAYRFPNTLGLDREFRTYMERDRYMAVFNAGPDELGGVFVWSNKAPRLPDGTDARAKLLVEAFDGAAPQTREALSHCPAGRPFYIDRLEQIELPRWRQGRICLVGDAAHCLTLFSGRGAAAAMVDADRLAQALNRTPDAPDQAFAAFEAAQKPKIDAMQRATRRAANLYVPRNAALEAGRNTAMRWLPGSLFERYFQAKYSTV